MRWIVLRVRARLLRAATAPAACALPSRDNAAATPRPALPNPRPYVAGCAGTSAAFGNARQALLPVTLQPYVCRSDAISRTPHTARLRIFPAASLLPQTAPAVLVHPWSSKASRFTLPRSLTLAWECKGCPGTFCKGCHGTEHRFCLGGGFRVLYGIDFKFHDNLSDRKGQKSKSPPNQNQRKVGWGTLKSLLYSARLPGPPARTGMMKAIEPAWHVASLFVAPHTCQRKAIMGHQPRDMWATGPQPGWLAPHNCKRQAIVGYPAYHNFVKRR